MTDEGGLTWTRVSVLAMRSFNPLSWAQGVPFDPPRTVGDVVDLYTRHQLRMIRGIGPRRTSEIEAALVLAGLDLTRHQVQPASGKEPPCPSSPPGRR